MKTYTIESNGEIVEYVEIEVSEGNFTSMSKAIWDELNADSEGKTK